MSATWSSLHGVRTRGQDLNIDGTPAQTISWISPNPKGLNLPRFDTLFSYASQLGASKLSFLEGLCPKTFIKGKTIAVSLENNSTRSIITHAKLHLIKSRMQKPILTKNRFN